MKAVLVEAIGGGFVSADVELADPLPNEVVVDVKASGLCHTDLTYSRNDLGAELPMLLGHEIAGVVSEVGTQVVDFQPGDHVVACLVQWCGRCRSCLSGRVYRCEHPERTLRAPDQPARVTRGGDAVTQVFGLGGFAQRALIHENQLVKVPSAIPFPQAALLGCGGVTGAGAVINTADTQAGDAVVIIGAGGVGLNAVNGAVVAGASPIIAVDIDDAKLDKARRFGATHTVNSRRTDVVTAVKEIAGGGADAVFDFVGVPAVTLSGLEMLRDGGGLYLIGIIDPAAQLELTTIGMIGSQKRVQGVVMGSTTPRRDIPLFAQLYLEGRFELDDLVSREIALDEVEQGYEMLASPDVTRVVITSGLSD